MHRKRGRKAGQWISGWGFLRQVTRLIDGRLKVAEGKGKRAVWDARIDDPFGRPARMPLDVDDLFVHGVVGPRKWLVQPELTTARVLGTKERGSVVFVTFSLYLVPSHSQLRLFLVDPPFVSAFVAPLSCLVLGFWQSRLEWFKE